MADDVTRNETIQKLLSGGNFLPKKSEPVQTLTTTLYEKEQDVEVVDGIKKDPLIEALAELEHDQWMAWAKNIVKTENITPERKKRWEEDCFMPYEDLSEEMKDYDREWAYKVINILKANDNVSVKETIERSRATGLNMKIERSSGDLSQAFKQVIENKTQIHADNVESIRGKYSKNVRKDIIESIFNA